MAFRSKLASAICSVLIVSLIHESPLAVNRALCGAALALPSFLVTDGRIKWEATITHEFQHEFFLEPSRQWWPLSEPKQCTIGALEGAYTTTSLLFVTEPKLWKTAYLFNGNDSYVYDPNSFSLAFGTPSSAQVVFAASVAVEHPTTVLKAAACIAQVKVSSSLEQPCSRKRLASPLAEYKITASERTFAVERSVLADASPVFATLFQNKDFLENKTKTYHIPGYSAEAVEQFLLYCYYERTPEIGNHALEVIKLAHSYEVEGLVKLCEVTLISAVVDLVNPEDLVKYAEVAALLKLELLLAAVHLVLKERYEVWTKEQRVAWSVATEKDQFIFTEMNKAVAVRILCQRDVSVIGQRPDRAN